MLVAVFVAAVALVCFLVSYKMTYDDMKPGLKERVELLHDYLEEHLDMSTFADINKRKDCHTG